MRSKIDRVSSVREAGLKMLWNCLGKSNNHKYAISQGYAGYFPKLPLLFSW